MIKAGLHRNCEAKNQIDWASVGYYFQDIKRQDQFLNQVKLNQVNFIITIGVIITNSSIITIINVFFKISLKTLHYHYYYHYY